MGVSATRNAMLDASWADYVIFFDDDIIPSEGILDAYVKAFRDNSHAKGFAGSYPNLGVS